MVVSFLNVVQKMKVFALHPKKKSLAYSARPDKHNVMVVIFGGLAVMVAFATVDP